MNLPTAQLLLTGLAAGDALGSTAEFAATDEIPELYRRYGERGWPFRQVGGGRFDWAPGQTTDDTAMARCLLRSVLLGGGRFTGAVFARELLAWLRSKPRDIGRTTYFALQALEQGSAWHDAGRALWLDDPDLLSNGSLMRNGVVPGLARDPDSAFELSLHHGIVTHYAPLCVLCCTAQTWLLHRLLHQEAVEPVAWVDGFLGAFDSWLRRCRDPLAVRWRDDTAAMRPAASAALLGAQWDPDTFVPFGHPGLQRPGSVLFTLQVALWALHWSRRDAVLPTPPGLPPEVFARTGPWVLGWVAMIGGDADTYGATAGPLLAALHGGLPEGLTRGLGALL